MTIRSEADIKKDIRKSAKMTFEDYWNEHVSDQMNNYESRNFLQKFLFGKPDTLRPGTIGYALEKMMAQSWFSLGQVHELSVQTVKLIKVKK